MLGIGYLDAGSLIWHQVSYIKHPASYNLYHKFPVVAVPARKVATGFFVRTGGFGCLMFNV